MRLVASIHGIVLGSRALTLSGPVCTLIPAKQITGIEMPTLTAPPLEVTTAALQLGQNIRVARIRRRMSQEELAQACGITRKTLYALEKGGTASTLGTVFTVLWKLGLLSPAAALADPDTDEHGRILEAARPARRGGAAPPRSH